MQLSGCVARAQISENRPVRRTPARAPAARRKANPAAQKRALDDPLRKRIYKAIEKAPGLPLSHLLTRLDVGWSTLYRELGELENAGLVTSKKRGRHCLVFPSGQEVAGRGALSQTILLQGRTAREIAHRISKKPGQDMESLAEALDLSPRVVYYHLRRLVEGKLIKSSSTTRYRDLAPTPALNELLKAFAKRDGSAA